MVDILGILQLRNCKRLLKNPLAGQVGKFEAEGVAGR